MRPRPCKIESTAMAPRKRKLLSSEEEREKKKSDKTSDSTTSKDELEVKQSKKRRHIKKIGTFSDEEEDDAKDYNKTEDMSYDGKEIVTRKMVLEIDQDSNEEIVEIHPDLVCKLKPHQVNGVKFMWECTIESVKDLEKPGSGCILAHCMGLGKTLQVIAFLHTCLSNPIVNKKITRAMIICPYNTALNWASEFNNWLDDVEYDIPVHQLTSVKTNIKRIDILKCWFKEGGVIIMSYDVFRHLASGAKLKKSLRESAKYILDPGPDIVVCDEGHVLKNVKSAISLATSKLSTRRRIVLTGKPLQNNLKEYHSMLSFVKPNLLGTSKEFRNMFVKPIMNGQHDDSNQCHVKLMKKRIHVLHKLLEGCVQKCDYSALTKFLPTKHEFVISVKLSEVQMKMYECYLDKLTTAKKDLKAIRSTLFIDFNNLRCIWTHPYICHASYVRQETRKILMKAKEEEIKDRAYIDDGSEEEYDTSTSEESDDTYLENWRKEIDEKKKYRVKRAVADGDEDLEDKDGEEVSEESEPWYHEFISYDEEYKIELSGKMVLLVEILKMCEAIGDKVILFSQSLLTLDVIEEVLKKLSSPQVDTEDSHGTWIKGHDYFRMDGATSADFRKSYIDKFNDPSNDRSRLFLISTRAGSLGTNLVGANRVIIFDTSWNPSHDVQTIFRVYRFGQSKPVYIYRLLAQGTMEEKIYDRRVTKLPLSGRVVDEQQIDRHFSAADLAELYAFDRNSTSVRPTPMVPKDRLLAELLIKQKDWIVTYHEHDSLLQSQTEEDLTEEERQAAWQEYENEREGWLPETNTILNSNIFDFTKDPDWTQDYEGKIIPDITTIVTNLFGSVRKEWPDLDKSTTEFKKRILMTVNAVRRSFQEQHLRLKQEYMSELSPVPNALNKYMDELADILKSTGEYVSRLTESIKNEERQANLKKAAAYSMTIKAEELRKMQANLLRTAANQAGHQRFMHMQNAQNMQNLQNALRRG